MSGFPGKWPRAARTMAPVRWPGPRDVSLRACSPAGPARRVAPRDGWVGRAGRIVGSCGCWRVSWPLALLRVVPQPPCVSQPPERPARAVALGVVRGAGGHVAALRRVLVGRPSLTRRHEPHTAVRVDVGVRTPRPVAKRGLRARREHQRDKDIKAQCPGRAKRHGPLNLAGLHPRTSPVLGQGQMPSEVRSAAWAISVTYGSPREASASDDGLPQGHRRCRHPAGPPGPSLPASAPHVP